MGKINEIITMERKCVSALNKDIIDVIHEILPIDIARYILFDYIFNARLIDTFVVDTYLRINKYSKFVFVNDIILIIPNSKKVLEHPYRYIIDISAGKNIIQKTCMNMSFGYWRLLFHHNDVIYYTNHGGIDYQPIPVYYFKETQPNHLDKISRVNMIGARYVIENNENMFTIYNSLDELVVHKHIIAKNKNETFVIQSNIFNVAKNRNIVGFSCNEIVLVIATRREIIFVDPATLLEICRFECFKNIYAVCVYMHYMFVLRQNIPTINKSRTPKQKICFYDLIIDIYDLPECMSEYNKITSNSAIAKIEIYNAFKHKHAMAVHNGKLVISIEPNKLSIYSFQ